METCPICMDEMNQSSSPLYKEFDSSPGSNSLPLYIYIHIYNLHIPPSYYNENVSHIVFVFNNNNVSP